MEESRKVHDMIDVTDCLEARDAFKGMKNFCFWLMITALVILQLLFWMDRLGMVERECSICSAAAAVSKAAPAAIEPAPSNGETPAAEQTAPPAEKPVEQSNGQAQPQPTPEPAPPMNDIERQAREVTQETDQARPAAPAEQASQANEKDLSAFKVSCTHAAFVIHFLNFILILFALLYSLTLLISLKISLMGRLGGINHISRSFILSLFLLAFLLPWQSILPGFLVGAVYQPRELLCFWPEKMQQSNIWEILMYLRFTGLWLLAVWLLLWSWLRSGKWYRATLRRLGIVT